MLQLALTLVFAAIIFWLMWVPLGARQWVSELLRDERVELREKLDEVEDCLAELDADPQPDDTSAMLREHFEKEARVLRRRLARAQNGRRKAEEVS